MKGRKLKSKVWDEFTKSKGEGGRELAKCSHCEKMFDGSSKKGTTHLKNHLERCRAKRKRTGGDEDNEESVIDMLNFTFEYGGILKLNSRQDYILKIYQKEKEKLREFLNKLSCRFTLEIGCDFLRVHYINDSWAQQSKVIVLIGFPQKKNIVEYVIQLCLDWKMDRKICSIISSYSKTETAKLYSCFSQRASLPFGGLVPLVCEEIKSIIMDDDDEEDHLKVFTDAFHNFNYYSVNYITQMVDFPTFSYLLKEFIRCKNSEECEICESGNCEKDKYWSRHCLILVIVIILDPRFKMDTVKFWYKEIYGSNADGYFEEIIKDFRDVYNEYAKDTYNFRSIDGNSLKSYTMLDVMGRPSTSSHDADNENFLSSKSELDLYLDDLKVPKIEEFDILVWWHGNAQFYPTLVRMARDYLAIPIYPCIDRSMFDNELTLDYLENVNKIDGDFFAALICLERWLST